MVYPQYEKYEVLCYEIVRYEVRLSFRGSGLGGPNYFNQEEDAIAFARKFETEHPGWIATVLKIERIIYKEKE